jgi:hypothetical protein
MRVRLNELLCGSARFRRAERLHFLGDNVIAEIECHELLSWVDSTRIFIQPAIRLSTQAAHHSIEARRDSTSCQCEAET